ncbi:hypothetical protein ACFQ05_34415 [Amycolatopsis umgeniensis]|uniref:Lipoprotein n=1 Tax=Amycolatopsis umgeniensis TaxID=336628 RepID=A0A841BAS4_9PSEU|nr:hypothetical protein [Amycolatopsis umgeniensis]MBB5855955.1 hypothetical protein [Amycolatopsis umgeniensis]
MSTQRVAGFLLVSAAALAGCGSDTPPASPPPTSSPAPVSSPATVSSSSPAPVSSSGVAHPDGPLVAAQGTDLKSCRDGDCEVIVKPKDKIAFEARLRVTYFAVDAVTADGVTISAALTSGARASFSGRSGSSNGIAYTVTAVKDGKAVLKLTPAT